MRSLSIALPLLAVAALTMAPLSAADIDNLAPGYEGGQYHTTDAGQEFQLMVLSQLTAEGGGKFSGNYGSVPITGKVTNTGKMTFSGKTTQMGATIQVKSGKGQLSATGRFIIGSFTVKSDGKTEKLTFSVERTVNPCVPVDASAE